ncbi:hypothetical protein CSA37_11715 [Candidatus Fermentibacteria bacterium]|nr:MAG: hypothetical protein CSA37_11715 [Candidatus Fermentibacteria bacterium]
MSGSFNIGAKEIEDGKVLAGISYFGLIGFIIAMLAGRDNRFTMFHAQQSLLISLLFFVRFIPFTPWILDMIVGFIVFFFFIIGLINGFSGKVQPLPLVGEVAYSLGICKADAE